MVEQSDWSKRKQPSAYQLQALVRRLMKSKN